MLRWRVWCQRSKPWATRLRRRTACEIREASQVAAQLLADLLVGEGAIGPENLASAGDLEPALAPEFHAERAEDRQPGRLGHDRAEAARRGADQRHRPAGEDTLDVGGRPRQPVDGILEHAGNRVVVLR